MAAGDVFANMHLSVSTSVVTVTPAANTLITFIRAPNSANAQIYGVGSGGNHVMAIGGFDGGTTQLEKQFGWTNCKMFIDTVNTFGFRMAAGTDTFCFSGVEI